MIVVAFLTKATIQAPLGVFKTVDELGGN